MLAETILHHTTHELVDELLAVAPVAALGFLEAVLLQHPAAVRGRQLEGPQEAVGLLEVRADGEDLVDQVIDAVDVVLAWGEVIVMIESAML